MCEKIKSIFFDNSNIFKKYFCYESENTHNQLFNIVFTITKEIPQVNNKYLNSLLCISAYLLDLSMWDEVSHSLP